MDETDCYQHQLKVKVCLGHNLCAENIRTYFCIKSNMATVRRSIQGDESKAVVYQKTQTHPHRHTRKTSVCVSSPVLHTAAHLQGHPLCTHDPRAEAMPHPAFRALTPIGKLTLCKASLSSSKEVWRGKHKIKTQAEHWKNTDRKGHWKFKETHGHEDPAGNFGDCGGRAFEYRDTGRGHAGPPPP
eukprot:1140479-Pelagomonas_calceolata.AAC.3